MASASQRRRTDAPSASARPVGASEGPSQAQLAHCEQRLDPTARAQLREQRRRLQRQLDAPLGAQMTHNSLRCITIAQANLLAEHNGFGMALPFLDPQASAETNIHFLSRYFALVNNAHARADRRDQHDLDRCVDLAASYLFQTDWFEQAPLPQLAHLANKLSKYPARDACRQALDWIGATVLHQGAAQSLDHVALQLLLNALSKHPTSNHSSAAVAYLARHLRADQRARPNTPKGISLLLNAFSKWPTDPDCTAIAVLFASALAHDHCCVKRMDALQLSTTLNALSKWPTQAACLEAGQSLAEHLAANPRLIRVLNAQNSANTLNALSKQAQHPHSSRAARALVDHLRNTPAQMQAMDMQGLATTLNALSKWSDQSVFAEMAESVVARLRVQPSVLRSADEWVLATVLNALSKWPLRPSCCDAAVTVAKRFVDEAALIHGASPLSVANALNALSKWPEQAACRHAAQAFARRLANDAGLVHTMNAQGVANALNALSKWPLQPACGEAGQCLARRLGDDAALRQLLDVQECVIVLNALSKWPAEPSSAAAVVCLAKRLCDEPDLDRTLNAQQIANVLNAVSKWPAQAACLQAAQMLAARWLDEASLATVLDTQGVANALDAFSKWPEDGHFRVVAAALARHLQGHGVCSAMKAEEVVISLKALRKWPQERDCSLAAHSLATRCVAEPRIIEAIDVLGLVNTLNAVSQWPTGQATSQLAAALAVRLSHEPALCNALRAHEMAAVLNALSKWPECDHCSAAVTRLAERLSEAPALCHAMRASDLVISLNALCKWPGTRACGDAVQSIARRLINEPSLQQAFTPQHMANGLNALSKWPDQSDCACAALAMVDRVIDDVALQQALTPQHVANVFNAVSKWPTQPRCLEAAVALAGRLTREAALCQAMNAGEVVSTLNALSKWSADALCQQAADCLATTRLVRETTLCPALSARQLANVLNALSRWPSHASSAQVCQSLAVRLGDEPTLIMTMNGQDIANSLNGLSKWPAQAACIATRERLVTRLINEADLRAGMNGQEISMTLNALSLTPTKPDCVQAATCLAADLVKNPALCQQLNPQALCITLNALTCWPNQTPCLQLSLLLSARLGSAEQPWRGYDVGYLAQACHALSHLHRLDDAQIQTQIQTQLHGLAAFLDLHPERFASAPVRDLALILKAFASVHLQREMRQLALPALERIHSVWQETALRDSTLETIGSLCQGLLPMLRSPLLTRHRQRTLLLFDAIHPIVHRKIDRFLTDDTAPEGTVQAGEQAEEYATRCPALTFYQVLKAYAVVGQQWKTRTVAGPRDTVQARRRELRAWVSQTLERTRAAITADLGVMSWNLIAQIEAGDDALDALDLRMRSAADQITQSYPPSRFDLRACQAAMRTAPGKLTALTPDIGATDHHLVDIRGKELKNNAADAAKPYSLWARLTQRPLVEVQLPGEPSAFLLARTFHYQQIPWRFDVFGGSRFSRGGQKNAAGILSGLAAPKALLPAIPYSDTAPGCDTMRLISRLAPQREDWSRIQRALLEMVPHTHVVEGTLRLGFCDDVPGPAHPFRLINSAGEHIALCPNDGCGFLRFDVALTIPVVRDHIMAWLAQRDGNATAAQRALVSQEAEPKRLAPQAMQHFPRDPAALAEAHAAMSQRLAELTPPLDPLSLYTLVTSGGYRGAQIRAIPSADDNVYLPQARSADFDAKGGPLLIGKAPYDKENLLPVAAARVVTPASGDATARFLSDCFAIQYSYTGFNDDASADDPELLHSKGMLVIPAPDCWSPAHAERDLVCSKEDLKTLSRWTSGRDRAAAPQAILSTGSLRVKEVLLPGRLGALPLDELRKRAMDTDGDDAFVYAGYPHLAALISRVMTERDQRRGALRSFKPPKTATPAWESESGHYHPGRAAEILAAQRGQRLVAAASNLATRFLAQPDDIRTAMAREMLFGTYDGIERSLRNGLYAFLAGTPCDLAGLQEEARLGIARAHLPEARAAAELLHGQIAALAAGTDTVTLPSVPAVLAASFPPLALAYEQAQDGPGRIRALIDNFPVCRLSHALFPDGQPGWIDNEPELTVRHLCTIAIKVGTDAIKSDTGTRLFTKVIENCERTEHHYADRVRKVPHGKETARLLHDNRFNPAEATALLERMPTMAAGIMQDAIALLQQGGWLPTGPQVPAPQPAAAQADIADVLDTLLATARTAERAITPLLRTIVHGYGARLVGEEHTLKSRGSLAEKIVRHRVCNHRTLAEVHDFVNDALRYSVVLPVATFVGDCRRIVAALDDAGHSHTQLTNHFTKRNTAFAAVSVTLRAPTGGLWEIQFHTEETFVLKERYHDLYKRSQQLQRSGAPFSAQYALTQPAWQAFRAVELPPDCEDLTDWP